MYTILGYFTFFFGALGFRVILMDDAWILPIKRYVISTIFAISGILGLISMRSIKDVMTEAQLAVYRDGIKAYGGNAPTYHIEFAKNGPQLVWDFHSLSLGIQMMLSFMITDEKSPLKAFWIAPISYPKISL